MIVQMLPFPEWIQWNDMGPGNGLFPTAQAYGPALRAGLFEKSAPAGRHRHAVYTETVSATSLNSGIWSKFM